MHAQAYTSMRMIMHSCVRMCVHSSVRKQVRAVVKVRACLPKGVRARGRAHACTCVRMG